jgi:DNA-binding protein HU-beta
MAIKAATSKTKTATKAPPVKAAPVAANASSKAVAKGTAKQPTRTVASKAVVKAAPPTTITLKHFAIDLAERLAVTKKEADTILADLFGGIVDHLKAGERVRIGGLGIIEVKSRAARMGRNPATGEAIHIKASKKIAFRAAKELKDAI